jgi:signal transduction histidine kinase
MKLAHRLILGLGIAVLFNTIIFIVGIRQQYNTAQKFLIQDAIDIATTIEQSISLKFDNLSLDENLIKLQKYVASLSEKTARDIVVVNNKKIIVADIADEQEEIGKEFIYDNGEIRQTMLDGKPRIFREVSEYVPEGVQLAVVPLYNNPQNKEEKPKVVGAVITSYEEPDLTETKNTFFIIFTIIILVAVAVGIIVIRGIYKPFAVFKQAVTEIGRGNWDLTLDDNTGEEIDELAAAFNKMLADLKRTTTSIENLNREVAERKQAQSETQKLNTELGWTNRELQISNEKLESANNDLKNFVYIASHDLREPLRKISMFGLLLETSLKKKIASTDAENLHFMIDGAQRMTQMIEGLLVYSRVSTQPHPFQYVDMNEIVQQICGMELSVVLEEKKAVVDISQPLAAVEADTVQIRQLMQNLIANGLKYQPKGATPKITITSRPAADEMIRIEVTDNGIGIKPEYHTAIFEMFKRLHTRAEYEGTGIGLAVCKRIVERHGGTMGVESQFGQGSTFWFTVPSAKVPVPV